MSLLMSGGGLRMGQAVGATDARGEEPVQRPVTPNEVKATWYKFLGVPLTTHIEDHFGRPTPILPDGEPIRELA